MTPIEIKENLLKDIIMFVVSLIFVAFAVLMISKGARHEAVIGWIGAVFFGLCAITTLWSAAVSMNKPALVVYDWGLMYLTLRGYREVRFSDANYFFVMNNDIIAFYARKPKSMLRPDLASVRINNLRMKASEVRAIITPLLQRHGVEELH